MVLFSCSSTTRAFSMLLPEFRTSSTITMGASVSVSLDRTARAVGLALLTHDEAVYGRAARQRFHEDGGKKWNRRGFHPADLKGHAAGAFLPEQFGGGVQQLRIHE